VKKPELQFFLALAILLVATTVAHFRTLSILHNEPDELVYTFLAIRLAETPSRYDLQGELRGESATTFLEQIAGPDLDDRAPKQVGILYYPADRNGERRPRFDPSIYDRPIFHHPPAYPLTVSVMQRLFGTSYGVLASIFFHALAIFFTAMLGRFWMSDRVGLFAGAILAVDGVSWVCAERIWIDSMLQAMVVLSLYAGLVAGRRGTLVPNVIAGLCLAIACLTKLPAILVAPAIFLSWRDPLVTLNKRVKITYLLTAALPVVFWQLRSARIDGSLIRLSAPTDWMIQNYPFIARMLDRSPIYYVVALLFASPLLGFALGAMRKQYRESWMIIPVVWFLTFFVVMSILGVTSMGFQLRYLAPMIPALCILAAVVLVKVRLPRLVLACALGAYSLHVGLIDAIVPGSVGPGLPKTFIRFCQDTCGFELPSWFLGIW
jgi:4-amino-4-deoxy-L-arabinose transferase-like glycosyltransferase